MQTKARDNLNAGQASVRSSHRPRKNELLRFGETCSLPFIVNLPNPSESLLSEAPSTMIERFDLVSADRAPLGRTAERGSELAFGEYHIVAMALMVNPEGKILVTKRSKNKTAPGKWECTAGSVVAGETSKDAMMREIKEEIGVDLCIGAEQPTRSFFNEDAIFDVWVISVTTTIEELVLQSDEVDEARYMTIEEVKERIEAGQATDTLREIVSIFRMTHGRTRTDEF